MKLNDASRAGGSEYGSPTCRAQCCRLKRWPISPSELPSIKRVVAGSLLPGAPLIVACNRTAEVRGSIPLGSTN